MKLSILALAFLLTAATTSRPSEVGTRMPTPVSILELIANPDKHDGKSLGAVGYLELRDDNSVLYLHREDFDFGLYVNSLKIEFEPKLTGVDLAKFDLHYVYLRGKFDAKDRGPRSDMGGSIKQTDVVILWTGPKPQPVTSPG